MYTSQGRISSASETRAARNSSCTVHNRLHSHMQSTFQLSRESNERYVVFGHTEKDVRQCGRTEEDVIRPGWRCTTMWKNRRRRTYGRGDDVRQCGRTEEDVHTAGVTMYDNVEEQKKTYTRPGWRCTTMWRNKRRRTHGRGDKYDLNDTVAKSTNSLQHCLSNSFN